MGNNASTGMYAQIEAATYTGGQMMRGTVYCDLKEPVQVALLYLKVVGEERTYWQDDSTIDSNMPGSTSDQSRTGYGDVLKARVPLFGPGTLPPGYHAFPFQAQLPPNLPGSMEFNGHYASRATIEYHVQAVCDPVGAFNFDLKSPKLPFRVLQAAGGPPLPVDVSNSKTIMTCCCLAQGDISGRLQAPASQLLTNTSLPLTASVNNASSNDLSSLSAKLEKEVTLRDNFASIKRFNETVATAVLVAGGVRAGSAAGPLSGQLFIPPNVPLSAMSRCVQVQYYLVLVGKTSAMSSDFEVRAPVVLTEAVPPPTPYPALQAPPNWKPTTYPAANVANLMDPSYSQMGGAPAAYQPPHQSPATMYPPPAGYPAPPPSAPPAPYGSYGNQA